MSDNSEGLDVFGRHFMLKPDLRQRDVAAWGRAYVAYGDKRATADNSQANLQASIEADWILSPECRYEDVSENGGPQKRRYFFDGVEVGDMLPAEVAYYGRECGRHYDRAVSVPKPTSSQ